MTATAKRLLAAFDALPPKIESKSRPRSYAARPNRATCPKQPERSWRPNCSAGMTPRRPRVPTPDRGDIWLVDLGYTAKVQPCLVVSVTPEAQDRVPGNAGAAHDECARDAALR